MRLKALRSDWEELGTADAYWAVLSDPAKRGNKWDVEEFYATGRTEIDYVMSYVGELRPDLTHGDALDFGCGPGRLTLALAEHFTHAVGVDISAPMIALADRRKATAGNCEFVHNERGDLTVFGDESFDFVYSRIVLQHIPTPIARHYVAEFVRVLRPGGLALFQIPDRRTGRLDRVRSALAYQVRRRRDDAAKVRIFGVPRQVVEGDVASAGGHLMNVAPDGSIGAQDDSWLYAVTRGSGPDVSVPRDIPIWRTP